LAVVPQMDTVRKELLERAANHLDVLRKRQAGGGDAPKVRLAQARAATSLADLEVLQGKFHHAEHLYEQSVNVLTQLHSEDPANIDYRKSLARAYDGRGLLWKKTNRYVRSEESFLKAIKLREQDPGDEEQREALARSQYNLGTLLA